MGEVLIDESLGIPTFQLKPISLHGSAFLSKRVMDVVFASLISGFGDDVYFITEEHRLLDSLAVFDKQFEPVLSYLNR